MSNESKREKEARALDALIVGALRRPDAEGEISPDALPELTAEEKEALAKRREGLLERVFAEEGAQSKEPFHDENSREQEFATVGMGSEAWSGFNRAEEVDDESSAELERHRNEVLERRKNERKGEGSA